MSVSALFPNIKPALLLDFANTKKLDPRVTFTRSTTAAYYDGVTTAKAEENLLLNSVSPANSSWEWVNGYPGSLGSELVTNGDFTSNLNGWTATNVTWGGAGVADFGTSASLKQVGISAPSKILRLEISITVQAGTRGRIFFRNFADTNNLAIISGPSSAGYILAGVSVFYFASDASGFSLNITTESGDEIEVDYVSVKEVIADAVTAPDGTSTASTFTADAANATFTQSIVLGPGEYTFSVYLRRVTGTGDIDIQCGGGTWVTQAITSSWARYTVTQTLTAGTRTPGVRIVTSGDQVEIWGAQLEQRSSATVYTPTTTQPITNYIPVLLTAPANVPRFDHNPVTEESLGLLIEEQRTNLVTYSEGFDNAAWTKTNAIVLTAQSTAPSGQQTAFNLVADATNNVHKISNTYTYSATAGTLSIYVKDAGARYFGIAINSTTPNRYAFFDLQDINNYTLANSSTINFSSISIQSVGNGWYRISVGDAFVGGSPSNTARFYVLGSLPAGGGGFSEATLAYTGNGYSGIFIWGAQLEAGSFPTSYIPTTSATVTRNADAASMIGSNFSSWYNQDEGSVVSETSVLGLSTASLVNYPWVIDSGSSVIGFSAGLYLSSLTGYIPSAYYQSAFRFNPSFSVVSGSYAKTAMAYKDNDYAATVNGAASSVSSAPYVPSPMSFLSFSAYAGRSYIKKFSYYPQRLTNAQLQALTA